MTGGAQASPLGRSTGSLPRIRRGLRGISAPWARVAGLYLVTCLLLCVVTALVTSLATSAIAADRIRIAAQKTGTLAWELDIIRNHGLDKQANLDIQVV